MTCWKRHRWNLFSNQGSIRIWIIRNRFMILRFLFWEHSKSSSRPSFWISRYKQYVFSKIQFAYWKQYWTIMSLSNVIDSWYWNIDQKGSKLAFSLTYKIHSIPLIMIFFKLNYENVTLKIKISRGPLYRKECLQYCYSVVRNQWLLMPFLEYHA